MRTKIYFAGSIRAGRRDAAIYAEIITFLRHYGEVLTEHVGNLGLTEKGDDGPDDRFIHDRDMTWLRDCHLIVAEVSTPSLGVGYELGWAAAWEKPTLCLYNRAHQGTLSAMIAGSPDFEIADYKHIHEAKQLIDQFIHKTSGRLLPSPFPKDDRQ